jgi:hypothetical protein
MLEDERFGHYRPGTAGSGDLYDRHDQVSNKNQPLPHAREHERALMTSQVCDNPVNYGRITIPHGQVPKYAQRSAANARRETVMIDLIAIFGLAKDTLQAFFTRRRAVAEKSWDEVALALDTLSELSNHHVKAIAEVTAPLLNQGDLVETSRRYGLLVNNPDFPQGYDLVRGVLAATRTLPAFREPAIQEKVRAVIDGLFKFQYGAFTLAWDSYRVADAFADAARVASQQRPAPEDLARAADPFIRAFTGLFQDSPNEFIRQPPATSSALVALLQSWCKSWQRYVQKTLYEGHGLNSAIGQLRMQRYA